MTSGKSEVTRRITLFPTAFDDIFESFRMDLEDVFYFPKWSFDSRNELVSDIETRLPLCDMEDLGDKYDYCRSSGNSKGQDHS